jgi:uncharacterized protein YdhG (YjbR/CyaY superfamily)
VPALAHSTTLRRSFGKPQPGLSVLLPSGSRNWRLSGRSLLFGLSMSTFDDYLATVPDPQKAALERVCGFVRSAVPEAEEGTSYGMPAFKYKNRPLLGFKASKNHLSVYPFSPEAVEAARPALAGFDLSKGTVRFTAERPIPEAALEEILRHRLAEIEGG